MNKKHNSTQVSEAFKDRKTKLSRYISLILRHKPEIAGITVDRYGWAPVDKILDATGMTMHELEEIVYTDEKHRYSFNTYKTSIRANQGHSIDVDLGLEPIVPLDILYHGTSTKALKKIYEEGISKRSRRYVHLSSNIEIARNVGIRHGNCVVLVIDSKKMYEDGYKFYLSENKVWLTDHIPKEYIVEKLV